MSVMRRTSWALGLLSIGYALGAMGLLAPERSVAQDPGTERSIADELGKETVDKVKAAYNALSVAINTLQTEKRYSPAMRGLNAFATLSGGVDAKQDLETGRGVDPETFAALYAEKATDDIAEHLDRDEEGRLTYKGKVVRMYSISRLKKMFDDRDLLAGLVQQ